MKKNLFTICLIVIALLITSILFSNMKNRERMFTGRVIYIASEYIEIKKGKIEVLLHYSENTKYIKMDNSEGSKENIEICQVVQANYIKEKKKNIIDKIHILKESDCYR